MTSIKAVLFDFGGVIYRTPDMQRMLRWLRLLGIRDLSALTILNQSPSESEYVRELWTGQRPEQEAWDTLAQSWKMRPWLMTLLRRRTITPRHVDVPLLDFLHSLRPRLRTAILTNAGTDFRSTFARPLDLEGFVDQLIVSAEEGLCKPDLEIFHLAAERLGVRPEEAVFVDDMPENVAGARQVGMHAWVHSSGADTIRRVAELAF
jgi:epoxide hydrolase-like predicted phosphatase